MFAGFKYETIDLKNIMLDERNPRIVSQTPLTKESQIIAYLYDNEDLETFVKKIAQDGKNLGAERPYVVKKGNGYVVIEGNTRIAAYKILTGILSPPQEYHASVPAIPEKTAVSLSKVDCSVAPNRDALMPIMASAHFGAGDKSKWGYLGSRKAVYDELKSGKTVPKLSKLFHVSQAEIRELIIEYELYLKALSLSWTKQEKEILLRPNLAFNPPVRFLQTSGHKDKMGISYDTGNLKVLFDADAKKKFKHLVKKLVVSPTKGLGATASYEAVFDDYGPSSASAKAKAGAKKGSASNTSGGTSGAGNAGGKATGAAIKNTLFNYTATVNNALIKQLLKEAKELKCNKFPSAGTFLLRNIVESLLTHIIDAQMANKKGLTLDLESCLNLCASNAVNLPNTDKKVLAEFRKHHLSYLNLGAHGNLVPNETRLFMARDAIDLFIKKYA
ncbi:MULTISPECIES: hypothetical protein [Alphaproteobacteria]|uniref:hypothetical protein n=1 Tax=Alphaproteobacteria TaxID=28211 RepID=UPI0032644D2E